MGGGRWDVGSYRASESAAKAAGRDTFDYSHRVTSGRVAAKVHDLLDPSKLNSLGENVREVCDTAEHPNATPIAVLFDVTGSMRNVPRVLQKKLPQLLGVLQRKGYVEDPQIMFGAIGDAYSDRLPLQVGQFESDNRMDETLASIVLEGGGGGGNHESYELAAYYLARHVRLDANKRGRKGYLFLIGDERLYANIDRRQVEQLIGDKLQKDLSTEQVFKELQEKFEVFFLFAAQGGYEPAGVLYKTPGHGSYDNAKVCYWRDLLGQNALILEDAQAVCETIAITLATMEAGLSVEEAEEDLLALGADPKAAKSAGKALATVGTGRGGAVAKTDGTLNISNGGGADRL
jgi:hypothetical protein